MTEQNSKADCIQPLVPVLATTTQLGATLRGTTCSFRVWAPTAASIAVRLNGRDHAMQRDGEYFVAELPARAADLYSLVVDGSAVPDPMSRLLPEGVHGRTEIVAANSFRWADSGWRGVAMREAIIYELHVGTFTPEGTFDGVITKLDYLRNLGITAIELMPVSAFPGERNWGYDGVSPYSVHAVYGGPDGLKRLVNAAHKVGLAVILDVVYNHLGNEGNYLRRFGPYFTARHHTPWGEAVNFSSAGVREYFVQNALYWVSEYRLDGLRLDATQTIHDDSPRHILAEIRERVQVYARESGRRILVIAETDENDADYIHEYRLDGFWSDDLHHAVHALLTGERRGYYQDFGAAEQIVRALNEGYVFQGEHFRFWNAPRGTSAAAVPLEANVICTQNHDQVGNRAKGERLNHLVSSAAARKAAAALLLLAPHTPLIFMGQEFDASSPFQFFTNYGDPSLREAVRKGRRAEFKDFDFSEVPDPEDAATFARSKLDWSEATQENEMLNWYQALIRLRRELVATAARHCRAELHDGVISMQVPREQPKLRADVNLAGSELPKRTDEQVLYAADERAAVAVYRL